MILFLNGCVCDKTINISEDITPINSTSDNTSDNINNKITNKTLSQQNLTNINENNETINISTNETNISLTDYGTIDNIKIRIDTANYSKEAWEIIILNCSTQKYQKYEYNEDYNAILNQKYRGDQYFECITKGIIDEKNITLCINFIDHNLARRCVEKVSLNLPSLKYCSPLKTIENGKYSFLVGTCTVQHDLFR